MRARAERPAPGAQRTPDAPSAAGRLRRSFTDRLPYKLAALFFAVILWLVANERRLLRSALVRATVEAPARPAP